MRKFVGSVALAAVVAAGSALSLSAPAHAVSLADTWYVTGTFNDGGTLSGYFTIDVYGYLSSPTGLTTTVGIHPTPYLAGNTYTLPPASDFILPSSPPASGVNFSEPSYIYNLQLEFQNALIGPPGTVDLLNLNPTLSYECYTSNAGFCNGFTGQIDPAFGRYFISGEAVANSSAVNLGDADLWLHRVWFPCLSRNEEERCGARSSLIKTSDRISERPPRGGLSVF